MEEEEEIPNDNESVNSAVFQDIREQLEATSIGNLPAASNEVPPGDDVGVIFTTNAREDMVPLTINLDEPVENALSRAVGSNSFHFELKDGTRLESGKTFRQHGIAIGETICLLEGSPDSGFVDNLSLASSRSNASEETMIENVEDRIETQQDIDQALESAMENKGTIIINQPDGSLNVINVENDDAVHQIIARAVGSTDNEEYDLKDGTRELPRHLTFREAGIPYSSTLNLVEREINTFVRCVDGKNHCIQARRSDTVEVLKKALRDVTQVPLHQQRLQFQSKPLEDNVQLRTYGIRNNSHLESTYRLRGGAN